MYPNCTSGWMNTRELGSTPASDPVVTSSKPQLLRSPPWEMIIRIIPLLVDSVEVFRKGKKKKKVFFVACRKTAKTALLEQDMVCP